MVQHRSGARTPASLLAMTTGEPGQLQPGPDWTDKVTGGIEAAVELVRGKTVKPATSLARILVYGLLAGVLASVALLLSLVAGIRLLDSYLPIHPLGRRVWIVDAVFGAIFLGVGAFLWGRRRPSRA